MIKDATPNNQNSFKQINRLLCCIAVVFVMILVYARYGNLLIMEWVSEGILFLLLAGTLWLYRVDNCWQFQISGDKLYIRLSYNLFLRGDITIVARGESKTHSCWLQKTVDFPFKIVGNDYFLEIQKSKNGSFFMCSIETKGDETKGGRPQLKG